MMYMSSANKLLGIIITHTVHDNFSLDDGRVTMETRSH